MEPLYGCSSNPYKGWRRLPAGRWSCPLSQVDDLDPIGLLAHRILLGDRERARLRVDAVDRHRIRIEPDRQQEAAARIDIEAARRLLGREMADRRQDTLVGVDAITGERARLALAAIEKPAVGCHVQIGGGRLIL